MVIVRLKRDKLVSKAVCYSFLQGRVEKPWEQSWNWVGFVPNWLIWSRHRLLGRLLRSCARTWVQIRLLTTVPRGNSAQQGPGPLLNLGVLTHWRKLIFVVLFCFVLLIPTLLSRCFDSVEKNVIHWLCFWSLEYMIQKAVKSFRRWQWFRTPHYSHSREESGITMKIFICLFICYFLLGFARGNWASKTLVPTDNDFDIGTVYRKISVAGIEKIRKEYRTFKLFLEFVLRVWQIDLSCEQSLLAG